MFERKTLFVLFVFLFVSIFLFAANAVKAADNCQCSAGSLVPFAYNIDKSYTVGSDSACKTSCMTVSGVRYYSYSNIGNFGFSRLYNCICSSKSTWNPLQLFRYPLSGTFNTNSDSECNQKCIATAGSTYYSYSSLVNYGFTPIKKCTKDADCPDATIPICNKTKGICVSEAVAASTSTAEMAGTTTPTTPTTSTGNGAIVDDKIPGVSVDEGNGLITCGRPGGRMCTLCDLIKGMNDIIKYLMKIAIGMALLAMTIGGVMYIISAGDSGMVEKGKSAMKNALIGFVIIFTAYLIINTTINYLGTIKDSTTQEATFGMTIKSWGDFDCTANPNR